MIVNQRCYTGFLSCVAVVLIVKPLKSARLLGLIREFIRPYAINAQQLWFCAIDGQKQRFEFIWQKRAWAGQNTTSLRV